MTPAAIKRLRKRLKLSREAMARKIGYSAAAINKWEAGHRKISPSAAVAIIALDKKSLG